VPTKKMQHGHQMEIWVITRELIKGRHYCTSYDMQKEWIMLQTTRFEPKL
jgi:hypothetical protein